ncbi:MAG: anti-sigma factor ChrR (cupin superfamily) [Polaribacter sp.]|jgi:anti-sigma factor ChrR (cupin superfamily)
MKPQYSFADSNSVAWTTHGDANGVEIKKLLGANDQIMELYRFLPNTVFPDHRHNGPEFVYLLEGSARVDGKWIQAGWASAAETGTIDKEFLSGDAGCVFLTVYTIGSTFV